MNKIKKNIAISALGVIAGIGLCVCSAISAGLNIEAKAVSHAIDATYGHEKGNEMISDINTTIDKLRRK